MAIKIRKYDSLGSMDIGWLSAHYHFSFSRYYDPEYMGVGNLRVINDDIVRPGGNFDFHPHSNMEIITYIRSGAITHEDNLGNKGITKAGEVQVMSAGTGITHSEKNVEGVDTNLYQIWIEPNEDNVKPRWEQKQFPKSGFGLLVSGLPEHKDSGVLYIHADAAIYGGVLNKGEEVSHEIKKNGYVLVSNGEITLNGQVLSKGDGANVSGAEKLSIFARADAEVLVIDLYA